MSQSSPASNDQERYSRRLSDKIQVAFDHACDEGELAVAGDLLETLEVVLLRVAPRPDRREAIVGPLLASHERLWHLRASQNGRMNGTAAPAADDEGAESGATIQGGQHAQAMPLASET
jgi:hypothetical protein